jgi:hypothetical protein
LAVALRPMTGGFCIQILSNLEKTPDGHPKYPTCGHFKIPHPARLIFP